ncbi:MAG: DUF2510 domain-containing protein [Vicinamibacterales bacterium]
MNTAAENVRRAAEAARTGNLGHAFDILKGRDNYPTATPGTAPAPGDTWHFPVSTGDTNPYYPYVPPAGQQPVPNYPAPPPQYQPPAVPAGWYSDPFDGQGLRWWNGFGWTDQTNG